MVHTILHAITCLLGIVQAEYDNDQWYLCSGVVYRSAVYDTHKPLAVRTVTTMLTALQFTDLHISLHYIK